MEILKEEVTVSQLCEEMGTKHYHPLNEAVLADMMAKVKTLTTIQEGDFSIKKTSLRCSACQESVTAITFPSGRTVLWCVPENKNTRKIFGEKFFEDFHPKGCGKIY